MQPPKKKYISADEALRKLQSYCAYQERCQQEVKAKLIELGVYGDTVDIIMGQLIEDNFLNEERFAIMYAGGKFRVKQWGRVRIKQELKQRQISEYCIKKAMQEIPEDDYRKTLTLVLEKKKESSTENDIRLIRQKLISYGLQRGYEIALVTEICGQIIQQSDK